MQRIETGHTIDYRYQLLINGAYLQPLFRDDAAGKIFVPPQVVVVVVVFAENTLLI